jgi:uncharacterized protein YdcH (DUF465 family)
MTELEHLVKQHNHHHKLIEAAEAEKAPEEFIKKLKVEKLNLKDKIQRMQNAD